MRPKWSGRHAISTGQTPVEPTSPEIFVKTGTVEGTWRLLRSARGSAALLNDDAAGFLAGQAMNKENRLKTTAHRGDSHPPKSLDVRTDQQGLGDNETGRIG
jgi:hypothetical protein